MSVKSCGATKMQKKIQIFLDTGFSKLCNQHEYRERFLAHIDFNKMSKILSLTHICSLCMHKMARTALDINGV